MLSIAWRILYLAMYSDLNFSLDEGWVPDIAQRVPPKSDVGSYSYMNF